MSQTEHEYKAQITKCRSLFLKKAADYGTAWRILRLPSITDQIFIKANRIRTIQEKGVMKVEEGLEPEFIGIINYSIMALIQLRLELDAPLELPLDQVTSLYNAVVQENLELLSAKNHDYGEAWRDMRVSSMTDLILMKVFRTKQIEDNSGQTLVSEGVDANYRDMINYAVFCLIQMESAAA